MIELTNTSANNIPLLHRTFAQAWMKRSLSSLVSARRMLGASILALGFSLATFDAAHAVSASIVSAPLVTPSTATTYYGSATTHTNGVAAWSTPVPEFVALARTLGGGGRFSATQFTQNVFDYVRNNIDVEFRFGLGKGSRGALIDQSGTPFDQAELMVKLLRQGGVTANYQVGTITLTAQQFGQWTGLVTGLNQSAQTFTVDARQACQFLADGAMPAMVNGATSCASVSGNLTSVVMSHVWVQANGNLYDPSFKVYLLKTGIDLSAAMGCGTATAPSCGSSTASAAMTGATSGTDSTGPYVQHLNYTAMQTQLQTLGANLENWIKTNNRTALMQDVAGGPILQITPSPTVSATLSYVSSTTSTWTGDIPNQYRTTLRVRAGTNQSSATGWSNGAAIEQTFYADELAGRRLQIMNGNPSQQFILDAAPVASIPCSTCGGASVITDVHHPYAANSGTYAGDEAIFGMPGEAFYDAGTYPITVIDEWGNASQSTDQHYAALQEANPTVVNQGVRLINGDSSSGDVVQATYENDSQGVLLGKLLGQGSSADRLITGMGDSKMTRHHAVGIIFARPYDPVSTSYITMAITTSVNTDTSNTALRCPVFQASTLTWSMMESAVNAQPENSLGGLSAASYLALANGQGQKLYGNSGCSTAPSTVSYIATPGVGGGGALFTDPLHTALDTVKRDEKAADRRKYLSVSPADGGATLTVTDLVSGTGKFPESLPFTRIYRSDSSVSEQSSLILTLTQPGTDLTETNSTATVWKYSGPDSAANSHLGGGWTHNYNVTATDSADNYGAFGSQSALDASLSMATLWTVMDLMRTSSPANFNTSVLTSYSLGVKLSFDSVVVDKGSSTETFHRLPDGSYNTLSGASRLVQTGEPQNGADGSQDFTSVSLTYTGKDGDTISFTPGRWSSVPYCCGWTASVAEPVFKADQWRFPNGTTVSFSYGNAMVVSSWGHTVACSTSDNGGSCNFLPSTHYPQVAVLTAVSNNHGQTLNFSTTSASGQVSDPSGLSLENLPYVFRITSVSDGTGRAVNYNVANCPMGSAVQASLACNQFTATGPDGAVSTYTYNPQFNVAGAMASTYRMNAWYTPTAPSTPYQTIAYDGLQRVTSVTDANSHATTYYPAGVSKMEIWKRGDTVDAVGNTSTDVFDLWSSQLSSTDPLGRIKTMAYDNARREILETNPEGDSVASTYDIRSNLLTTTHHAKPGSGLSDIATSAVYMEGPAVQTCSNIITCNKPSTVTNAKGTVTRYTWNSITGQPATLVTGLNTAGTCLIAGGACPEVDLSYSTLGSTTLSVLTSAIQKVDATHSLTTTYSYYPNGFFESATVDPAGLNLTTTLTYDAVGNPTHVDGPRTDASDISDYVWDADRRLTMEIQAGATDNGTTHPRIATKYTYDLDGQLIQTDQGTTTTSNGSDFVSLLALTTAYDPVGNKIKDTTPTSVAQYSYDVDERLRCSTQRMNPAVYGSLPASACDLSTPGANGPDRITQNVYDAASQLRQSVRGANTTAQLVYATYKYSANGKQIAVADGDAVSLIGVSFADALNAGAPAPHQTNFVYDGFDRLKQTVYADGSSDQATAFDADGDILTRITRAGQTITLTYDALDRMATKAVPAVTGVSTANTVSWAYDLLDKISSLSDSRGNTIAYGYDLAGRQTSAATTIPGLAAKTISYQVDQAGNRTRITWPDAYYVTYGYDALNRMTGASESGTTALAAYDYDNLGHRAWVQYAGTQSKASYSWSTEGDLLTLSHTFPGATANNVSFTDGYLPSHQVASSAISNTIFQYIPVGGGTPSYTVNGLNQYTAVAGAAVGYDANGNLTTSGTTSFAYDPENRLMTASLTGTTASYAYDPLGRRTKKTANSTVTYFLQSDDDEIAEYDGSGALLRRFVPGAAVDEDIAMVTAAGVKTFFHQDKTQSTVAMSTTTGTLAEGPYSYDAYGQSTASAGVPFKYTGQYYDAETGLYYYRARYYSPALGRFMQTDPVGYKDDINWYAYVGNDPTDHTDPTGEEIDVTKTVITNKNGTTTTTVHIKVTAELIIDGGTLPQGQTASSYASSIKGGIEKDFSGKFTDGKGNVTIYSTTVDMKVGKSGAPNAGGRHDFVLVANHDSRLGASATALGRSPGFEHGRTAYINEKAGHRTAPHEFGHLAGLRHPNDIHNPIAGLPQANLMSQTKYSNSENIVQSQFQSIANNPVFHVGGP